MKQRLKRWWFSLLGKDPEGVVVTFFSGNAENARRMEAEVRALIPRRRHFTVGFAGSGAEIILKPASTGDLYLQLRRLFRRYRIAMAPVLFDGSAECSALRWAAFFLAPTKILAYNRRLERHHLRLSTAIASVLFLYGVPVDRIFLRPWKRAPREPAEIHVYDGRPLSAGRPRIAILTPYFPYPLSHGGAVRIFHLLQEAAREFDLFLFAFTEGDKLPEYEPVLKFCTRITLVAKPQLREPRWSSLLPPEVREYDVPEMRLALRRTQREFGVRLLQTEYTMLASYGGDVLVEHDVTFDLYAQIHARSRSLASAWNLWRWRRFETRAIRTFRKVVVMSQKDAALLGVPGVTVIPNGVDLARFQPEPETPGKRLLFVGSFRHFPNIEAFRFFMDDVWPLVLRRHPDATFTLVAGPDHRLHWNLYTGNLPLPQDSRVRLLGFVRDVRPLYAECNLVVVPTVVSAGTNLKVLEAMAMERAVVSTPSGCAGLELRPGESVALADSAAAFAEEICRLFDDPELRRRIASAARRVAEERYDWSRIAASQARMWRELLHG